MAQSAVVEQRFRSEQSAEHARSAQQRRAGSVGQFYTGTPVEIVAGCGRRLVAGDHRRRRTTA
ncbi:MAG: hypothetical protein ACLUHE_09240 [Christensenellales bacterium]